MDFDIKAYRSLIHKQIMGRTTQQENMDLAERGEKLAQLYCDQQIRVSLLGEAIRKPGRAHPGIGVCALMPRKGDRSLLLLKRKGSHAEGTWAPPGGWIEHGERWGKTVEREVMEEVGVHLHYEQVIALTHDMFEPEGIHGITMFCSTYWCPADNSAPWRNAKIMEPDKCSELMWMPIRDIIFDKELQLFPPFQEFTCTQQWGDWVERTYGTSTAATGERHEYRWNPLHDGCRICSNASDAEVHQV